jgi:tryptophan synthase alpha chain
LKSGMTVRGLLALVERFRAHDEITPLVLMGYFNPIHAYGAQHFLRDAGHAGVDGLIVVDLSPEEDSEFRECAAKNGIEILRLATPTTTGRRLETVLRGAGGFLYYVSITGVTGTKAISVDDVAKAIARIRDKSSLPCAVGFGIRTPQQAAAVARFADAAVVGSAIVQSIAEASAAGRTHGEIIDGTLQLCRTLSDAVYRARLTASD